MCFNFGHLPRRHMDKVLVLNGSVALGIPCQFCRRATSLNLKGQPRFGHNWAQVSNNLENGVGRIVYVASV